MVISVHHCILGMMLTRTVYGFFIYSLSNDVTLKPSLGVLVNMASGCMPIQMQLRSLDRNSLLRKTFIRLVGHDDNEISVIALAAMTSTGMSEEFNRLVRSLTSFAILTDKILNSFIAKSRRDI